MAKKESDRQLPPDQRLVTERQAAHLGKLAQVNAKELVGKPIAEVNELVKWKIDPSLLLFRRICGRVVKLNPATVNLEPVPNATVHVEDTDCSFLGFFPFEGPFFWLFPVHCHREELATVTTDACGKFCVYIPYWDVDRYLRFRLKRICFPDIFKPTIRDILKHPLFNPPIIGDPRPQPDPPPFRLDPGQIQRIAGVLGPEAAERVERTAELQEIGASNQQLDSLLDGPAFPAPTPPPLPREFREGSMQKPELAEPMAARLPIEADQLRNVDFNRYLGPFLRCVNVLVPEWVTFLDVPDLTFRVTQDVDNTGAEETIYSEGFFDVRWNAPSNLYVTLVASPSAISVPFCGSVEGIDCADQPAIVTTGYMPLEAAYHDNSKGVGTRVNRPRPPDGRYTTIQSGLAHAPYTRSLNLHGCQRFAGATHYRLTYAYRAPGATSFTSPVPFTGLEWWAPRLGPGAPIHVVPDADGWYPILPAADLALPNWLLFWPTLSYPDGLYETRLELGHLSGGSISVVNTSDPKRFLVDNTKPTLSFVEIRWRPASVPLATPWTNVSSTLLPVVCPVITRPGGVDIHLRVIWSASADHLRNAHLTAGGCGGGGMSFVTGEDTYRHWYINEFDNSINDTAVLLLPGDRPPGCYHVRIDGWGRQFNPSGFDYGPIYNWYINQGTFSWNRIVRSISLVNT